MLGNDPALIKIIRFDGDRPEAQKLPEFTMNVHVDCLAFGGVDEATVKDT